MQRSLSDIADPFVAVATAAKMIGVNRSTLSRQVRDGSVRSHRGKVRLSEVLADRARNIDLTRSRRRSGEIDGDPPDVAGVPDATPDATADATTDDADEGPVLVDGKAMAFKDARALKETYLARLRKLEYDLKSEAVVPIEIVVAGIVDQYGRVRNKLLALGARVGPRAAMLRAATEVQALVDQEVVLILEELTLDGGGTSNYEDVRKLARRMFGPGAA